MSRRGRRLNRRGLATAVASAPAPPATTPLTVYGADLHQWLRSDLGITLGTGVSAWADQSGKGNHAIQGTGTAQPSYSASDATCDGRPSLTGDGSNDVLASAALTTDLATDDFYICAILKQVSWTAGDSVSSGSGSTMPRFSQVGASPALMELATSNVNSNTGAPVGTWVRGEVLWSVTAGASYVKLGSTVTTGGNPGTGTRTASSLFAATASAFAAVALAEFIVVRRAAGSGGPSAAERALVDTYLQGIYPSASF